MLIFFKGIITKLCYFIIYRGRKKIQSLGIRKEKTIQSYKDIGRSSCSFFATARDQVLVSSFIFCHQARCRSLLVFKNSQVPFFPDFLNNQKDQATQVFLGYLFFVIKHLSPDLDIQARLLLVWV